MKVKQSLQYRCEPEKYLFGIGEVFDNAIDPEIRPEQTIELVGNMGFGSMRLWMHHKKLLQLAPDGKVRLNDAYVTAYRGYIDALLGKGVTHLVSMNHSYLYPASFDGDRESENQIPLPDSPCYAEFLHLIEESYATVAAAFPQLIYYEVGNEENMHRFIAKPNYHLSGGIAEKDYDERYCYTREEKARITVDICYYANRGVKRGNPNAFVVMPSPTPYFGYAECVEFVDVLYRSIESGKLPTGLPADTDPDNYFQILSWHPYNFGGDWQTFTDGCNLLYDVAKRHGDDGKKVFITEFGYHDFDFVQSGRCKTKQEADALQARFFRTDFEAFRQKLPYVETVHVFRLYDWIAGPGIEVDFGLFTSPAACGCIRPKEKGKAIYRLIHGENADLAPIEIYAKKE